MAWKPGPPSRLPPVGDPDAEVGIEIETIIISETHDQQLIVFRELDDGRRFSFVLGIFEATAIDRTLRGMTTDRPLTYDSWLTTVEALGGSVRAAVLQEMEEGTYFADLGLDGPGGPVAVDMRPSDAVHLALKAGAPIRIVERLLAEVAE